MWQFSVSSYFTHKSLIPSATTLSEQTEPETFKQLPLCFWSADLCWSWCWWYRSVFCEWAGWVPGSVVWVCPVDPCMNLSDSHFSFIVHHSDERIIWSVCTDLCDLWVGCRRLTGSDRLKGQSSVFTHEDQFTHQGHYQRCSAPTLSELHNVCCGSSGIALSLIKLSGSKRGSRHSEKFLQN